jgi:hypothetical protein
LQARSHRAKARGREEVRLLVARGRADDADVDDVHDVAAAGADEVSRLDVVAAIGAFQAPVAAAGDDLTVDLPGDGAPVIGMKVRTSSPLFSRAMAGSTRATTVKQRRSDGAGIINASVVDARPSARVSPSMSIVDALVNSIH